MRFADHQHACAANRHIVWLVVPDRFAPVLRELAPLTERFRVAGHCLYLVGGTVRDLLVDSDRADFDLDLTTDARPDQIKACLDGWADSVWNQGEKFGTIGANKFNPETGEQRPYEITTFRAESYTDDSRKPHVVFADEIETDLSRRDFTVNAMALELTGDSASGWGITDLGRPIRWCPRFGESKITNANGSGRKFQRRPVADVAGRPFHRALSAPAV